MTRRNMNNEIRRRGGDRGISLYIGLLSKMLLWIFCLPVGQDGEASTAVQRALLSFFGLWVNKGLEEVV